MPARAEGPQESSQNIAYDRIMKTGEIRCGYFIWPPYFNKDLNTGAFSGVYYDLMAEAGRRLQLKITWAMELNFGTYLQDLAAHKYDMEVGGWPTAIRGKLTAYSTPTFYIGLVPVVREGDTRFDGNVQKINDPAVTVATIDGENSQMLWRDQFSAAKELAMPQNAAPTDLLMNVLTKKADVTFLDTVFAREFMEKNPGKLKLVHPDRPLKVIPQNLTISFGEPKLLSMMNTVINEMLLNGTVDRILDKYDPDGTKFYRVAPPFMMKGKR